MEEAKIYIQFEDPSLSNEVEPSKLQKALINLLSKVIPKANPDFEGEIVKVKTWYLEFILEGNFVEREIGFNNEFKILLGMPFKDNYGYWTDSNLTMEDFIKFNPKEITKEQFDKKWETLKNVC